MIGRTLAHYEVLSLVGKGGMGEVYRARDTKLDREVALKVLPREVSGDPERAARFEREARTLASLNHPHIAQIFGIEAAEGIRFLVMEFVEGEDLAQRLRRGALDVDDAIKIAIAMAEGLEAAHRNGVVHRDLKPANVKVTPEGAVKILDFGLARAFAGEEVAESDPAMSPTITQAMTVAGTILGTAAYMSPEQARGRRVDKRADLWAFGVIFFELLCGRRMFDGGSTTDTLAAVLRAEIDFDRLPDDAPLRVRRVLRRCLQRDVDLRQRDAGDVRLELLEGEPGTEDGVRSGVRRLWPVALVAGAILGAVAVWMLRPSSTAPHTDAWRAVPVDGPHFVDPASMTLRRDGRQLAYSQRNVESPVMLLDLDGTRPHPLPGSEGGFSPCYSPDGQSLAYATPEGIFRSRVDGSGRRRLTTRTDQIVTLAWSETDTIYVSAVSLLGSPDAGILALPATGGDIRVVTALQTGGRYRGHLINDLLPDQRHGLVVSFSFAEQVVDLGLVDLWTGEIELLEGYSGFGRWSSTGHLLVAEARQDALLAIPFSPDERKIVGPPATILQGIGMPDVASFGFVVSGEGTLVWGAAEIGSVDGEKRSVVRLGEEGSVPVGTIPPGPWADPALSPNGRTLVARKASAQDCHLWTFDLETGASAQISFEGDDHRPVWLPDGRLAFTENASDHRSVKVFDRVPGPSRTLLQSANAGYVLSDCTPDGAWLFVEDAVPDAPSRGIYLVAVDGSAKPRPWLVREAADTDAKISPEGTWVVHVSRQDGRQEVFLRRFDDVSTAIQVSANGGRFPFWSRDGKTIYYESGNSLMACDLITAGGVKTSPPRRVATGVGDEFESSMLVETAEGILAIRRDRDAVNSRRVTVLFGLADRIAQSR